MAVLRALLIVLRGLLGPIQGLLAAELQSVPG